MITKKSTKRILSLMLCLAVTACMCLSFSFSAYAAEGGSAPVMPAADIAGATVLANGGTVTPVESSDVAAAQSIPAYRTPDTTKSADYTYNFSMPQAGTLVIQYATTSTDVSCYVKVGSGATLAENTTFDSTQAKVFYVPSAGSVPITFSLYASSTGAAAFSAWYVPATKAAASGTEFLLGATAYDAASTFTMTVPSNGYITVNAINGLSPTYSVKLKANGFKNEEYLSSSNGYTTNIGVKKGTYTISLRGASIYDVKATFHKVKETSAKTSKAKAASIKKKASNKGIIPVNKLKKVHWYKIKNPKNQKLTLAVNAKKMSSGGSYSAKLKITVYFPDKKSRYATLYTGNSDQFSVTYGTIGTKKARKGTYYVKVQSVDGANGYYTLKWK